MKRVVFPSEVKKNEVKYSSFSDMLEHCQNVGFKAENLGFRYMVVTEGPAEGYAVRPGGTYTGQSSQPTAKGVYYVFDSPEELCRWMAGADLDE